MLAKWNSLSFEFAAQSAEVAQNVDGRLRLRARLGAKRIAGLKRNGGRKLFDTRLERIGDASEKTAALPRSTARPGGKGIGRGFHGPRDIFGAAARDHGNRASVRWIFNF
jgi:hypothetical protein